MHMRITLNVGNPHDHVDDKRYHVQPLEAHSTVYQLRMS